MIRKIFPSESVLALPVFQELRPDSPLTQNVEVLEAYLTEMSAKSYALVGSFEQGHQEAVAVAGYRVVDVFSCGKRLYLDDFGLLPEVRGRGHARALLRWLDTEAVQLGCGEMRLDSQAIETRWFLPIGLPECHGYC